MSYAYNNCITCKRPKVLHHGQCLDCEKAAKEQAAKHLGSHWDTKIGGTQEHLGPPGIPSYVKKDPVGIDVLGYWPAKVFAVQTFVTPTPCQTHGQTPCFCGDIR